MRSCLDTGIDPLSQSSLNTLGQLIGYEKCVRAFHRRLKSGHRFSGHEELLYESHPTTGRQSNHVQSGAKPQRFVDKV